MISRARKAGNSLPEGAPVFDVSAVRDISEGALGKLRDAIQTRSINFDSGKSLPAAGQEQALDEIATDLIELAKLSSTLHAITRVTLTGHADSQGQGTSNLSLSVARAEAVRALLKKRGVDPDLRWVESTATKSEHGDISRVRRGGCWADSGWPCRSAFRLRFEPERRHDHIGFRVVLVQT